MGECVDLHLMVQGSRLQEIQQISNRRALKWDQVGLSETTRRVPVNCENERLRW